MTCPRCGNDETSGKFCNNCGASLGGASCRNCGAALSVGAKFCHVCAAPVAGRASGIGTAPWLPWALGSALVVVLIVAAIFSQRPPASVPPAAPDRGAGLAPPAPDISRMTPRQRADALFNRVVSAQERGLTDSVGFFRPMALAAYGLLGDLDADGHYHVGLIHAVTGTPDVARAHADSIEQTVRGHLFASIVRMEAARAEGDRDAARRSEDRFLERYATELAADRSEYRSHPGLLEGYYERITAGRQD